MSFFGNLGSFIGDSVGEITSHPWQAAGAAFGVPGYDPFFGGLFNNRPGGALISPTGNFTSSAWQDMYRNNPGDAGALGMVHGINAVADKVVPVVAGMFAAPAIAGALGVAGAGAGAAAGSGAAAGAGAGAGAGAAAGTAAGEAGLGAASGLGLGASSLMGAAGAAPAGLYGVGAGMAGAAPATGMIGNGLLSSALSAAPSAGTSSLMSGIGAGLSPGAGPTLGPGIAGSGSLFGPSAGMDVAAPSSATTAVGSGGPFAASFGGSQMQYPFTMTNPSNFNINAVRQGMQMLTQNQQQQQNQNQQQTVGIRPMVFGNPAVRNAPVSQPMPYDRIGSSPQPGQLPFQFYSPMIGGSYV